MKNKSLLLAAFSMSAFFPALSFGQAPELGTAAGFALFSSNGAVKNVGTSNYIGNIGTQNGSSTGFGNVNGVMHDQDDSSMKAVGDLKKAYDNLNLAVANKPVLASSLGNGQVLTAGIYSVLSDATLSGELILNGGGNPNAVFILKVEGTLSTNVSSKIKITNGTKACNVFWKVEGLVKMATNSTMRGTIIANNAAIEMTAGDTLEGRALSTTGAITANGVYTAIPVGCSAVLNGPAAPDLLSTACYGIFSASGEVTNTGITYVNGDVGTNVGLTTGFNQLFVKGMIHSKPDGSTDLAAKDLQKVYAYLNTRPHDIELLYPVAFGHNLTLTPHTYLLDAATVLTDTVYLDALGNTDAVFVIKINGALSAEVNSKVILKNGAQAKNVFWKIDGATKIKANTVFAGTIVGNQGAIELNAGLKLDGRAFTTTGTLTVFDVDARNSVIPAGCTPVGIADLKENGSAVVISPNPFSSFTTIVINDASELNKAELKIYNSLGVEVLNSIVTRQLTTIQTANLASGVYYYKVISHNKTIQTGRLVSQQ